MQNILNETATFAQTKTTLPKGFLFEERNYSAEICLDEESRQLAYNLLINSLNPWNVTPFLVSQDMDGLLRLLHNEIERISRQADFIAIVCNTVHALIQPLRERVSIPIMAIYEEVCRAVALIRPAQQNEAGSPRSLLYPTFHL